MDWICLLLDANFTVLLMIPEAKRLLLILYNFVKSQVCGSLILSGFVLSEVCVRVGGYMPEHESVGWSIA
jgi:hypothetical protein